MSNRLKGKVAVITGASKGLGAAIARRFGAEGATVVVNYSSSKAGADAAVQDIVKSGGQARAVKASMREPTEVKRLFEETNQAFGAIHVLVITRGCITFKGSTTCPWRCFGITSS